MQGEYLSIGEGDATVSFTSTGDKRTFNAVQPIDIIRWGLIVTVAAGGAPVVALDKRPTAGSDTSRVNAAGGTITPGALAAGLVAYAEPSEPLQLDPGEQVVVEATTAATTTGSFIPFIVYRPRPFVGDRKNGATKFTA